VVCSFLAAALVPVLKILAVSLFLDEWHVFARRGGDRVVCFELAVEPAALCVKQYNLD
jgi:hypothetical protein